MQIAVEVDGVTAVSDDAMTVVRLFVEPVTHRVCLIVESKQTTVHQARRFWLEYVRTAEFAVGEMSHHELGHVGRAAAQAAGRKWIDDFKRFGLVRTETISIRHQRREFRR